VLTCLLGMMGMAQVDGPPSDSGERTGDGARSLFPNCAGLNGGGSMVPGGVNSRLLFPNCARLYTGGSAAEDPNSVVFCSMMVELKGGRKCFFD
jgi:hypothetical protein